MKSCLLVIDVQESFRHRPYFSEAALPAYLAAQNALIAGCVAAGVPVVRVLHSDGPEVAGNPFALASGHVRALDGLRGFEAAATFVKHRAVLRNHHPPCQPGVCERRPGVQQRGLDHGH